MALEEFPELTPEMGTSEAHIYTVSELTREIKVLLETTIPVVWVEGEISNFKLHSSGHMYFSLKDENAQIAAVMWRGRNMGLRFIPEDGMKVLVQGKVTVYEKRGNYQLDVLRLQPAGVGELQLAFEQLKNRLRQEGLFAEERKRPIPRYPERVGIVTSATGAALQDILNITRRRLPGIELILRPALVQGEGAAEDIAKAIAELNEYGQVDVIIVGRGGGSLEDLWAFNEEVVARAIYASRIPVVSAVGHEVDFTIADFVADLRAPTPSAAAELVVPDRQQLHQTVQAHLTRAYQALCRQLSAAKERLNAVRASYGFRRPEDIVHQYQQRLDDLTRMLTAATSHAVELARQRHQSLASRLAALGPQAVLARGYSICFRIDSGEVVRTATQVAAGEAVGVQLAHGRLTTEVSEVVPNAHLSELSALRRAREQQG
ncbi:MAG: exodeoxyribonuclease VII large subunit [candidate division KSB1 bacterium]|nr:exodeoxyribonuclease VII large subunit [candidate division KSB1 bacterium]